MGNSNQGIYVMRSETTGIADDQLVKVYEAGNVTDVVAVRRRGTNLKKFRKTHDGKFMNVETGEIICLKGKKARSKSGRSLKKSFADLRRLINKNFQGDASEKHLVLTYNQPMMDYSQAVADFKKFWGRFQYYYKNCIYIRILEPQRTGRWHIHLLLKNSDGCKLKILYQELFDIWGRGLVFISDRYIPDNFGAYFTAIHYDTDEYECVEDKRKGLGVKCRIKGERLKFYPPQFRLYACSKGIQRVKSETMPYRMAKEKVQGASKCYSLQTRILKKLPDDTSVELNRIEYEQYRQNPKSK